MGKIVFRAERNGAAVLALDSGLKEEQFAKSGRAVSIKERGIILSASGEESVWEMRGTFCRKESGTIAFYGADFEGSSLLSLAEEAVELSPQDGGKKAVLWRRFVSAVKVLYKSEKARRAFAAAGPASVLCGKDDMLLVLPPAVFADCASSLVEEERFALEGAWVHPYLAGGGKEKVSIEKAFAFTLGCLARKILAGEHPFAFLLSKLSALKEKNAEKPIGEEFGTLVGEKRFVPAKAAVWGIGDAAAALDALLTGEDAEKAICSLFSLCAELPTNQTVGDDESFKTFNLHLSAEKKKLLRKHLAKRGARRHRGAIAAAVLCAVFAVAIGFSVAQDVKSRPTTADLDPYQVVTGFYEAIGSLNQEIIGAYAEGGAEKRYADMTAALYVTQKMIEAYSLQSLWVTPHEFYAAAREGVALPQDTRVCGITSLEAKEEARTEARAEYNVSFFFWAPSADSESGQETGEEPSEPPFAIYACADQVTVTFNEKKMRWAIAAIESAEWVLLPVTRKDITEDAARCAEGGASRYPFAPQARGIESLLLPNL